MNDHGRAVRFEVSRCVVLRLDLVSGEGGAKIGRLKRRLLGIRRALAAGPHPHLLFS